MSRLQGDDLMVRRAARGVALQAAALVGAAMVLLVVAVGVVVVRSQANAVDTLLSATARSADDVDDPPPGAWVVLVSAAGQVSASPGLPEQLTEQLAELRAGPGSTEPRTHTTRDDERFRVLTRLTGSRTVQVVADLRPQHDERTRLLRAMSAAGAASLLVAGLLGAWLGRRSVRPLAEALALQRSFVADASHELRTPLTLLSTRVQLLERAARRGSDPQLRSDAEGVVRDVQRLGEVVEDLLVAADPRRDDQHTRVDVAGLVAGVTESARPHAEHAGVRLTSEAADLPGAAGGLAVLGAPAALRRALLALTDNAIEHTPPGGSVTLRARRSGASVSLSVSDTGPGIAPEATGRLLHRFHSGGQRSGRTHYGLGLALTHDVANRHGGRLRLVPSDSGATFELTLPAATTSRPKG
ncbi:MAG: histidine kinase [Frankiales bacterium]|nr:histidine kinase [Frankiales bacterium]